MFTSFISKYQKNRRLLLFVVYVALFLDNMLLTVIIPIIPEYLMRISHPDTAEFILHAHHDNSSILSMEKNTTLLHDYNLTLTSSEDPLIQNRDYIIRHENIDVGILFGSKAFVQLLATPWVGPLTNRIGYSIPMFIGFIVMFSSTVLFAFGSTYIVLFIARSLQGIGSACTSVCGMGLLAQAYTDDKERGSAMGIALGGLALGVLAGPIYGGIMYQFTGKELPFIILALLAFFDGGLQLVVLQPKKQRAEEKPSSIMKLLRDPYVLLAAGSITMGNLGIAVLECSLPLWMMEVWSASPIERGIAFIFTAGAYLLGTNLFGTLGTKLGRWLSSMIGLILIGVSLFIVPFARSLLGLVVPHIVIGFSIGMIDSSMFPLMAHLVDIRHTGVYGSIYSIADASFCLSFCIGPFLSGPLVSSVGFAGMLYIIGGISLAYAPFLLLLRNPPEIKRKQESTVTSSDKSQWTPRIQVHDIDLRPPIDQKF